METAEAEDAVRVPVSNVVGHLGRDAYTSGTTDENTAPVSGALPQPPWGSSDGRRDRATRLLQAVLMCAARIRFADLYPATFTPSRRVLSRISLAWWDDSDPDPVFVSGPHGGPSTAVIVWPTDDRGLVLPDELRADHYPVLPWHLDMPTFSKLHDLHRRWPLARHDLLVDRRTLRPTRQTLRDLPNLSFMARLHGVIADLRTANPACAPRVPHGHGAR